MRKIAVVLMLLSFTAAVHAQSIVGNWMQEERHSEKGMSVNVIETLSISAGNMFEESVLMEMGMSEDGGGKASVDQKMKLKISCGGKWTFENGVLTQTFDAGSIRTDVLEQPEGFPKFFVNLLGKTMSSEFRKHSKKPETGNVLKLTADSLVVRSTDPSDTEIGRYVRKP